MKVKKAVRSSLSDSRESANHCMSLQPKPSWYVQPIRYSWDVSPEKPVVSISKNSRSLRAVSYTHLDVYKRQEKNSSLPYHPGHGW